MSHPKIPEQSFLVDLLYNLSLIIISYVNIKNNNERSILLGRVESKNSNQFFQVGKAKRRDGGKGGLYRDHLHFTNRQIRLSPFSLLRVFTSLSHPHHHKIIIFNHSFLHAKHLFSSIILCSHLTKNCLIITI